MSDEGQTLALQSLQRLHAVEVEQLRLMISQLLMQAESLHEEIAAGKHFESQLSQLREANQNLVQAASGAQDLQASAEAASQRQTELLSMLAHELRNPLQPIAMANALLGNLAAAHPTLPKLNAIIGRQVHHMVRLVDDLLDASRVSSGKIALQKRALALSEVVDSAVETSLPFFERRDQKLKVALPDEPILIDGDLVRLAQVFSNLLINASKFSPENESVVITGSTLGNTARISVRDNGMGVTADIQPFIFDLFTQGVRSLDRSQGGLGIGLSLVRTLVEMHGGTVQVASEGIGFGSEFIVLLPLSAERPARPVQAPSAAAPAGPRPRRRRILLVEDNVDASETLRLLLELQGHIVTQRFDGVSALAAARINHYDVVICDIGLPAMDGFAVVRQIRTTSTVWTPYFIATSGYNQAEDRARALACGFDHYLVKPVAIDILVALMELNTL
jgi:two-component system CheB/CheR fusion protein